ncbi:D-Tyr tRNAtyr deacylase-like domain-containing protein [Chytridium lagenaria]|nr:D-Tyr tRNAtyr deacylase-like domain-containing protein [Chytridium lagenaria]
MKAVIQRVTSASVVVNGETVSSIGRGLCVLVGITTDDKDADSDYLVRKILNLRLFDSTYSASTTTDISNGISKPWSKSVMDCGMEVLCVSQFTLYALTTKGSKPDFHLAMKSDASKDMYHNFLNRMKTTYVQDKIKDGVFGAMMQVNIVNDGPVTILLESPQTLSDGRLSKGNKKKEGVKKNENVGVI